MVFRKEYITPLPEWFKDIYNGDWALHMLLADKGKIWYIDEVMSVYRKNAGALSGGVGKDVEFVNKQKIKLLTLFNTYTDNNYNKIIREKIKKLNISTKDYQIYNYNRFLFYFTHPVKLLKKLTHY